MTVKELLTYKDTRIFHTTRDTTLSKAVDTLNYYNIGALLVMSREKLIGIVTERDVLRAFTKYQDKIFDLKVGDIMTRKVITCHSDDHLNQVMSMMSESRIRHLPVMEKDKLIGIISIGDVVKALLKITQAEARDLRDHIFGKP